jgi:hypothetical protein
MGVELIADNVIGHERDKSDGRIFVRRVHVARVPYLVVRVKRVVPGLYACHRML